MLDINCSAQYDDLRLDINCSAQYDDLRLDINSLQINIQLNYR